MYIAGKAKSVNSIASIGAHQTILKGSQDAFVVKFDFNGVRQWGTYYGGSGVLNMYDDVANGIVNDNNGYRNLILIY